MNPPYTERIRKLAAESPKSTAQLAAEVGVTTAAIRYFVRGHYGMRTGNLDRVARACGHKIEVKVVKIKEPAKPKRRRRIADFGSEA